MLQDHSNSIFDKLNTKPFNSLLLVKESNAYKISKRILFWGLIIVAIVLLLPWTQNIRAKGFVTSLNPSQRPQTLQSVISGKIEKWFVSEGQFVKKGDTILFISEVKDEYFDPKLLERTKQQIKAKESSVVSYMEKVKALDNQIDALLNTKELKMEQARNYVRQASLKIQSDSADFLASKAAFEVAKQQLERMEQLYKEGLKSLTELESRRLKFQEVQSKLVSAENKLLAAKNDLINAKVELSSIDNQFQDKLSKAESEKFEAMSAMYDAEGMVSKMQSSYMGYQVRNSMYYITAPQDGFITKAIKSGIGEMVKQGEQLVSIMPSNFELAVEIYVEPVDLPLLQVGSHVRFVFDGWPSIVFSGWPNASYGTFGGNVVAIDNFTSKDGKYRVLVAKDRTDLPWPKQLRVGSGAEAMALLNDVPVWYELWRNLNGFPPEYYIAQSKDNSKSSYDEK